MIRGLFFSLALFAATASVAATARHPAAKPAAKAPAVIVIDKMAYGPAPAGLHVGDTVQWANHDMFLHSVTAADHSFDLQLKPGATGQIVLTRAGAIGYTCKYHPAMKGQLVVQK
ncbi:MAG TPA: cupredoxin domain-containing protein [Caulobacteraceae bacterium]|jgi:plastocyanin